MSFVPHQERHQLHGVTVVLETTGQATYVGRLDTADDRGVVLKDVGIHDPAATELPKAEYLQRALKFGIRKDRDAVLVENERVATIIPLGKFTTA